MAAAVARRARAASTSRSALSSACLDPTALSQSVRARSTSASREPDVGLRLDHARAGLGERRAMVVGAQLGEQLAAPDLLLLLHLERHDRARRDRCRRRPRRPGRRRSGPRPRRARRPAAAAAGACFAPGLPDGVTAASAWKAATAARQRPSERQDDAVSKIPGHRDPPGYAASPSAAIRPSRICRTRSAIVRTFGSWVTIRSARSSFLASARNSSRTWPPIWESRLAVGSSASRIGALPASARAIATRCFWPPERSRGRKLAAVGRGRRRRARARPRGAPRRPSGP